MKTIRLLILLFASIMSLTAPSASAAASLDERLVGLWEEYQPSSNYIQFFEDHTVRLYLTEEEGGDATPPARYIGGTWSISDNTLTMDMSANGNALTQTVRLKFDEDEMVLIDDSDSETRHRRSTQGLPAKYRW